jgi:hypothetical protein
MLAVRTTILEADAAAKRAAELWAKERKASQNLARGRGGRTDLERKMEEMEAQRCAEKAKAGGSSVATPAQDKFRFSTLDSGQSTSHSESLLQQ